VGDTAGALTMLERAYQIHEGAMVYVQVDPAFAALRNDPRFQQLMSEVHKKA
jgi:ribosomal protein L21E